MRARTFAREIAFQVIYRDDLNPPQGAMPGVAGAAAPAADPLLEQGRFAGELMEFVRRLNELEEAAAPSPPAEDDTAMATQWLRTPALIEFTRTLVAGVREHTAEIDRRIATAAANWSLTRMAATDRNLLRLGAYELLYTDTPGKVAVDEAVELAKRFGGAGSAQFVNGILDKLLHEKGTASESGE
jgi:N utilization substance protein B